MDFGSRETKSAHFSAWSPQLRLLTPLSTIDCPTLIVTLPRNLIVFEYEKEEVKNENPKTVTKNKTNFFMEIDQ